MLRVPLFKQSKSFCGPASLRMVLAYYGLRVSERKLALLSGATRAGGVEGEGLLAAAKRLGFSGKIIDKASMEMIRTYIEKNVPVIVSWFSVNEGHYSVVVGIDKKYIYLVDPEYGKIIRFLITNFLKVWFDIDIDKRTLEVEVYVRSMLVVWPRDNFNAPAGI